MQRASYMLTECMFASANTRNSHVGAACHHASLLSACVHKNIAMRLKYCMLAAVCWELKTPLRVRTFDGVGSGRGYGWRLALLAIVQPKRHQSRPAFCDRTAH
jgi:hypothetical protein